MERDGICKHPEPVLEFVVMVTRGLADIPIQIMKRSAGSLAAKRAEIASVLDLLLQGFYPAPRASKMFECKTCPCALPLLAKLTSSHAFLQNCNTMVVLPTM